MQTWDAIKNWFIKVFTETSEIERDSPPNLRMLRSITIVVYVANILVAIFILTQGLYAQAAILGVLWVLLTISGALLLRGKPFMSRIFVPLAILVVVSLNAIYANGLRDGAINLLPGIIVLASLTLGIKGAIIFAFLNAIAVITIGTLEMTGVIVNDFSDFINLTTIFLLGILSPTVTASLVMLLINRLNQSLILAQSSTAQQKEINAELIRLQQNLEDTIRERTQELEKQSIQLAKQVKTNQRRAQQFQTIADVARYVANIRDLDILFKTVTELINQQLGYYHVGIFLNDEADNNAILVAANSEGGQQMLERNHRLKIGETGIVGNVAYTGAPRVALDTGDDAVFFNNPDLPKTRSEMAAPLKVSSQIVGVLDIQSTDANAFSQNDIEVFTALADQVAIAIENVRLFENIQKSLTETETVYRQYLKTEWGRLSGESRLTGFRYKISGVTPLESPLQKPEFEQAIQSGNITVHSDETDESSLVVPIKLRGEILGIVNIRQPGGKAWSKDEIELVQSVTDRLAISAENARLFEETTRRAERERAVATITTKIRNTNNPEEMLAIAVNEIKNVLNAREIRIKTAEPQQSGQESN
jgi:GAF domain-containing protein